MQFISQTAVSKRRSYQLVSREAKQVVSVGPKLKAKAKAKARPEKVTGERKALSAVRLLNAAQRV